MKIIASTKNKNKLREFAQILPDFEIISMEDAGIDIDIEENGDTFEENSFIKANTIYRMTGFPTIADDSGLEVEALDGQPGIYSARYGTPDLNDEGRVRLLLDNMRDVPPEKRGARFVCVITLVNGEKTVTARGECYGSIAFAPVGENGFGYDPVFYVKEYDKTTAQMSADEKNAISHRGKALRLFAEKIKGEAF